MAIYSTMGKWLLASLAVGAGATVTIIGVSRLSGIKTDVTTKHTLNEEGKDFDSILNSQKGSFQVPLSEQEDSADVGKNLEEHDENLGGDDTSLSQDSKAKSEEKVGGELSESPKESPSHEDNWAVINGETILPSIDSNHENSSNSVNWFSIKLEEGDIFDDSEWPARECFRDINEDQAVFRCNWNEEPTKPITFQLFISSSPDLKGKAWKNLVDLHLKPNGEDKAKLGLVFSDDDGREIEISLIKKELIS